MPAVTLSEIAALVDEYLGHPDRKVLDELGMVREVREQVALIRVQLGATGHLLTGRSFQLDPPRQEFLITESGFDRALVVQRLINPDNDRWEPINIVGIDELDNEGDLGNFAIAFYGQDPDCTARLSWDPNLVQYSRLRIWYEPNPDEPTELSADIGVPLNLIKYLIARRAAVAALPRLMVLAPEIYTPGVVKALTEVNQALLQQYEAEFDHWRFDREQEGWGQVESFDEQFRYKQRWRFF